MRFRPMAAAVTVALASSMCVAPAAQARTEPHDATIGRDVVVEQLGVDTAPPAVRIGDDLYVFVNGVYAKVDRELRSHIRPGSGRELGQGNELPDEAKPAGKENPGKESSDKSKIAQWLVPLLVTGGIIAGLAGLIKHLYPSGRLILYFQPGKPIAL